MATLYCKLNIYKAQNVANGLKFISQGINTSKKYDRISMTAVRKSLHRLPIKASLDFKVLVLSWKAYNGIVPKYLSDLLNKKYTTHNTHSADTNLLKIPTTKLVTCGDRTFKKAAPTLWNDLPTNHHNIESLASFKIKLKTHLFTKYYKP